MFSVPLPRDRHFIERKDILLQVEQQLTTDFQASLCGIGGIGYDPRSHFLLLLLTNAISKTQIAIEYAYKYRETHPSSHIFWVYTASSVRFVQAYQDIAQRLELPGYDDPRVDSCARVSRWLNEEESAQWLMILDNADDADIFYSTRVGGAESQIAEYLPRRLDPQRLLMITTRSRQVGEDLTNGEPCINVPPLSMEEAKDLLRAKVTPDLGSLDTSDSDQLTGILECIPLAITQASAFMKQNKMPLRKYLAALEKDEPNLIDHLKQDLRDHRRAPGVPNSIFRTLKLSFDQIQTQKPEAAKLLSVMAMLDRQQIPAYLIRQVIDKDVEFSKAVGSLDGFSLIIYEIGQETFTMHRLVQLSVHQVSVRPYPLI